MSANEVPIGVRRTSSPPSDATALLFDTSALIDIVERPNGAAILAAVLTTLEQDQNIIVFPDVVIEEFDRNTAGTSIAEKYKARARNAIEALGSTAAIAQIDINRVLAELESAMDKLGEVARTLISAVRTIHTHRNAVRMPLTAEIKAQCFDRLRASLPPNDKGNAKRSSFNDHVVWLCALEASIQRPIIFCTSNRQDFSANNGSNAEVLHERLTGEARTQGHHVIDFHDVDGFVNAHLTTSPEDSSYFFRESLPAYCPICGEDALHFTREPERFRAACIETMRCDTCQQGYESGAIVSQTYVGP